ncbi:MAG: hypothetical protein J6S80_01495 [Alphaproteobacteria bacterium]|nr:hypothetical protein [Alphaproteobacteria bacterium]
MTEKITPRQQEILDKIVSIAAEFSLIVQNDLLSSDMRMKSNIAYDLGMDSVDQVEFIMKVEQEFNLNISEDTWKSIQTVGDIVRLIEKMSAEPATKAADKKVATKTQTDTKSKPDVQITITNVPKGNEKPTTLNCGTITDAQKQDFLAAISEHKPSDGDKHTCGFNVYHAKQSAVRVVSYDMPTDFQPVKKKIGKNELIVEMVPVTTKECGSWANYHCPICLASGGCTSPFIKKYIGEVLFPDKYGKQR